MFQKLVSHNDDINRLVEKGYAIAFDSNYLIVRDVPYLDYELKLQIGAIVSRVIFIDDTEKIKLDDHQIFFSGSFPHGLDGNPIPNLGGGNAELPLSENCKDIIVQRSFSNKPRSKSGDRDFQDFFEKIESYVNIISGPAIELYNVTPYTFRAVKEVIPDSIFKLHDTLTSRAGIADLSAKFRDDVVAIIGLGGTGAYLLDFLVKTPVREIRAFDPDPFHVHNTFRSPGKVESAEFNQTKARVYSSRYDNFRHGLFINSKFIDASCGEDLKGVTFAFVCVDKGPSRAGIFNLLIARNIPFIDVGMGLKRKDGGLRGMLRMTYYSVEHAQKVRSKRLAEEEGGENDLYRNNIQISELNALNACLAVIKFKQLRGFYAEKDPFYHLVFELYDFDTIGISELDED